MKTKLFALMLMASVAFVSCDDDDDSDEFCENPEATCPDNTAIDATACCTDKDCYWTYKGEEYDCDGDNCTSALNAIVQDACAAGLPAMKSADMSLEQLKAEMGAITQKLLAEARACSGCN